MTQLTTGAVGVARPRIEGRAKVTGSARYAADEPVQDLAHGCLVVSTVSRGRIRDINDSPLRDQNIVLSLAEEAGTSCTTSQCSTIFPSGRTRKMSTTD
jgi:xanthine dehydrogenase YagR molybdenum-binding subunit